MGLEEGDADIIASDSMLPMAEHIIALDSSGTILAQGTFSHMKSHIPKVDVAHKTMEESSTFQSHQVSPARLSGKKSEPRLEDGYLPTTTTGGAAALKYYFGLTSWPAWAGFYGSLSIVVCMNTLMSNFTV